MTSERYKMKECDNLYEWLVRKLFCHRKGDLSRKKAKGYPKAIFLLYAS